MKEGNTNIESYRLPVTDVCHARRNFPGYMEYQNTSDVQGPGDTGGEIDYISNGLVYSYERGKHQFESKGRKYG